MNLEQINHIRRDLLINDDSDRTGNGDNRILGELRDPLKANLS